MSKLAKVSIVLLGYGAAVGLGFLAGWLNDLRASAFAQNSGGMVAEGDAAAFFVVTGLAMIFPTLLALFFLRSAGWFWRPYSWAMLILALTGPLLEMLGAALHAMGPSAMPYSLLGFPVVVRTFSVLFLSPGDFLSALIAPEPKSRRRLLIAFAIETALGLYVLMNLAFRGRFM